MLLYPASVDTESPNVCRDNWGWGGADAPAGTDFWAPLTNVGNVMTKMCYRYLGAGSALRTSVFPADKAGSCGPTVATDPKFGSGGEFWVRNYVPDFPAMEASTAPSAVALPAPENLTPSTAPTTGNYGIGSFTGGGGLLSSISSAVSSAVSTVTTAPKPVTGTTSTGTTIAVSTPPVVTTKPPISYSTQPLPTLNLPLFGSGMTFGGWA